MNATSPSLVVETAPELVKLRQIASKAFIAGLWLMVLVVGGVASYTPAPQLTISLIAAALAGVSTIMFLKDPIGPATRFAIGAALTTDWALLVFSASGLPDGLVLDAHMLFFCFECSAGHLLLLADNPHSQCTGDRAPCGLFSALAALYLANG